VEPFGTVTNFYPFLSDEIRETVESILHEAEGYDDFVSKLVDTVLAHDVPNDLTYFTAIHTCISGNREIGLRLRPLLIDDIVLKPWSIPYTESLESSEELLKGFPPALMKALDEVSGNWVQIHLLMLGALHYHPRHERQRILDEAKELIEKHPELQCFSPEIHISDCCIMSAACFQKRHHEGTPFLLQFEIFSILCDHDIPHQSGRIFLLVSRQTVPKLCIDYREL
jgi:hypothetical protein